MNRQPSRVLAVALAFILVLGLCLVSTAEVAPAPLTAEKTSSAQTGAAEASAEESADGEKVIDDQDYDEEESVDFSEDEEASSAEDEDDVIENPTEEEQFLTDLMSELDVNEANALEQVNGMTHILLIGIDARPGQTSGRSDTMMLLTIDAEHGSLKLTSFMRDLYVEIPGYKNNRLNAAYVFGGPKLLMKTLKKNFGVSVDYYAAVNFSTLADVIDQIGGISVNIETEKQMKYINLVIKEDNVVLKKAYPDKGIKTNDSLLTTTGEQILNGRQAQAYARYRKGSSDFERTQRQREVILKAIDKVKSMSMLDLGKLALENLDNITTNLTVADIIRLAPAAFQLKDADVKQLRIPIDKGYSSKKISGMAVLVPNRSKNTKAITNFLLN